MGWVLHKTSVGEKKWDDSLDLLVTLTLIFSYVYTYVVFDCGFVLKNFYFNWIFLAVPSTCGSSWPNTEPTPQQWQDRILNLLSHLGTPENFYFSDW